MWEFRVDWDSQNFASDFFELFGLVAEGDDFGWADESEVEWVEEEDDIFSLVVWDADIDEISVVPGWGLELRGWFSDQRHIFLIDFGL